MEHRTSRWRHHPVAFHGGVALLLAVVAAVALWAFLGLHWGWWPWLGTWLVSVNLTTLGYYGLDKFQARRGGGRIPEVVLHGLALAGEAWAPWAGCNSFGTRR